MYHPAALRMQSIIDADYLPAKTKDPEAKPTNLKCQPLYQNL